MSQFRKIDISSKTKLKYRQTDKQTNRQQKDRYIHKQTDGQIDKLTN